MNERTKAGGGERKEERKERGKVNFVREDESEVKVCVRVYVCVY
jgi:hypothetical protein